MSPLEIGSIQMLNSDKNKALISEGGKRLRFMRLDTFEQEEVIYENDNTILLGNTDSNDTMCFCRIAG